MKYKNLKEVKNSDSFKYFIQLGYDENSAIVLSLIDFKGYDDQMSYMVELYRTQNEENLSFVDFVLKNYFVLKKPIQEDEYVEEEAVPRTGGFFGGIVSKAKNTFAGKSSARSYSYCASVPRSSQETTAYCASVTPMARMAEPQLEARMMVSPEEIRTDSYEKIEEKDARDTLHSPTATFRPTFNTAAAGILLSNIRNNSRTRSSMVRTEELLNYLNYDLKNPEEKKFEVTKELKTVGGKTYLFLGVQGQKVLPTRQNICFLLDVSGSMSSHAEKCLLSIMTVLSKMNDDDIFSLVTYSTNDKVVINGLKLNKEKDLDSIIFMLASEVEINGCTNGSAGLNKAYDIIEKNMIKDGVNRVIIVTDGDLNFGIHDKDGLKGLIEKRKKCGAYFSAIGTGIWNIQDDKLESLAKNGNGNYFVINSQEDLERSVLNQYETLVYPIAKNVKAQVEFNPGLVESWKLIGYENRMLNHEDFRNDAVIAEPFGSGSHFIALFELVLNKKSKVQSDLKYQNVKLNKSDELGTLTVRYEDIDDETVKELEFAVESDLPSTENIKKAVECAEIAAKLREPDVDEMTRQKFVKLCK